MIQHVISDLTNITYDEEKETLLLGLTNEIPVSDEEMINLGFISNQQFTPSTMSIQPDETKTINFSVPSEINKDFQ